MKKQKTIHILNGLCMLILLIFLLVPTTKVKETITYFPLDKTVQFTDAETKLSVGQATGDDQYQINWHTNSTLKEPVYLRQDVTLLYMDGQLKSINGLWKENESNIALHTSFDESDSSLFEAITFHHGEIHYPNEEIKSIQKVTSDFLYVVDSPHTPLMSFRKPDSPIQKEWEETIDRATSQQLHFVWKKWINNADIKKETYDSFGLVDIKKFEDETISGLTEQETNRVIGQLWEGLYKNYIVPLTNDKVYQHSYMPLVLIDKNRTHLVVLFENNKNKLETLYQQLSLQDDL